jgi:undecaprenyl-diphosphatase
MVKNLAIILSVIFLNSCNQETGADILRELNLDRNRDFDGFFILVSATAFYIAYLIPLVMLAYALITRSQALRRTSVGALLAVLSSSILVNILKYIIDRPRPFVTYPDLEKLSAGGSPSFPSGHTADAFALATVLSLVFPRWPVIIISYAWALTVGYTRMSLGVHYPGDVLAGAGIGVICALILHYLFQSRHKKSKNSGVR